MPQAVEHVISFMMNKFSTQERVQIVSALVEGNSINATSRMVGVSNNTVLKLLADLKQCLSGQGIPQP